MGTFVHVIIKGQVFQTWVVQKGNVSKLFLCGYKMDDRSILVNKL